MRSPSPAPGASRRRCSAARTSASIRCTSASASRVRATLDLISLAAFAFFVALVTWHAWGVLRQSYVSGSRSLSELETPLVIPQTLWFAGLAFFVAVALLLLARALLAYLTGDLDQAVRADRLEVGGGGGQGGDHRASSARSSSERKTMTAAVSLIVLLVVLGSSIAVAAGMGLVGHDPQPALFADAAHADPGRARPGRPPPTSFSPPFPSTSCSARSCCAAESPSACTTR